jgi:hypothetical protein
VVPSATTLCVVNIGANEAKVECLLRSFVRLREQPGFSADDAVRPRTPVLVLHAAPDRLAQGRPAACIPAMGATANGSHGSVRSSPVDGLPTIEVMC